MFEHSSSNSSSVYRLVKIGMAALAVLSAFLAFKGHQHQIGELEERLAMMEQHVAGAGAGGASDRSLRAQGANFIGDVYCENCEEDIIVIQATYTDIAQSLAETASTILALTAGIAANSQRINDLEDDLNGFFSQFFIFFSIFATVLEEVVFIVGRHEALFLDEYDGLCYLDGTNITAVPQPPALLACYNALQDYCGGDPFCTTGPTNSSFGIGFFNAPAEPLQGEDVMEHFKEIMADMTQTMERLADTTKKLSTKTRR